jgi:hypothetical protein
MRLSFSTVLYLRLGAERFERWVFAANLVDDIAMGDTWTDGHGTVLYGTCGHGHRQKDEAGGS